MNGHHPERQSWFAEFWAAFWIKNGRREAEIAFSRVVTDPETFAAVMEGVHRQSAAMLDRKGRGEPVKYAQGWLNNRRWLDEEPVRRGAAPERRESDTPGVMLL